MLRLLMIVSGAFEPLFGLSAILATEALTALGAATLASASPRSRWQ
jgi:hypothetical protein